MGIDSPDPQILLHGLIHVSCLSPGDIAVTRHIKLDFYVCRTETRRLQAVAAAAMFMLHVASSLSVLHAWRACKKTDASLPGLNRPPAMQMSA